MGTALFYTVVLLGGGLIAATIADVITYFFNV